MCFSPDGDVLVSCDGHHMITWDCHAARAWPLCTRITKIPERETARRVLGMCVCMCSGASGRVLVATAEGPCEACSTGSGVAQDHVVRVWNATARDDAALVAQFAFDGAVCPVGTSICLCPESRNSRLYAVSHDRVWCLRVDTGLAPPPPNTATTLRGSRELSSTQLTVVWQVRCAEHDASARQENGVHIAAGGRGGRGGQQQSAEGSLSLQAIQHERRGSSEGTPQRDHPDPLIDVALGLEPGKILALSARGMLYEMDDGRGGMLRCERLHDGGAARHAHAPDDGNKAGPLPTGSFGSGRNDVHGAAAGSSRHAPAHRPAYTHTCLACSSTVMVVGTSDGILCIRSRSANGSALSVTSRLAFPASIHKKMFGSALDTGASHRHSGHDRVHSYGGTSGMGSDVPLNAVKNARVAVSTSQSVEGYVPPKGCALIQSVSISLHDRACATVTADGTIRCMDVRVHGCVGAWMCGACAGA